MKRTCDGCWSRGVHRGSDGGCPKTRTRMIAGLRQSGRGFVSLARAKAFGAFLLYGMFLGGVVLTVWACQRPSGRAGLGGVDGLSTSAQADMRVRLEAQTRAVTLGGSGLWEIGPETRANAKPVAGPVRVAAGSGGIRVIDARGRVHGFARGQTVVLKPLSGSAAVGEFSYPGSFLVVPRGAEEPELLDLINVVGVEAYVPGVLAQELYASWPLETYRAQAIAARSYALHERAMARDRGRYFDVEDDQRDQAYIGITDRQVAHDAAASTRGIVLTAFDRIIPAYYSSTCGGRSALAEEIWPERSSVNFRLVSSQGRVSTDRPFACETAPLFRWEVVRSRDALTRRVRGWAIREGHDRLARMGEIHSLAVAEVSSSGRPIEYRVIDVHGRGYEVGAEPLRNALNATVDGVGRVRSADRVRSNDFEFAVSGGRVRISGRGFGHGVGLCQYCAKGMAERGERAEAMLRLFYPAADLRRAY